MKVSRKVGRRKNSRSSSVSRRRFRNKKSRSGYRKKNAKTQKGGKRGRDQKRMGARTHKRGKRFHKGGINELERAMGDPESAIGKRIIAAAQRKDATAQFQADENKRDAITTAEGIKYAFSTGTINKNNCKVYDDEDVYGGKIIEFYLRGEREVIVLFKVKKEVRFSTTEPQKFYCILRYTIEKNSDGGYKVRYFLRLRRVDNNDIIISVSGDRLMDNSNLVSETATGQQILAEKLKSVNFLKTMPYFKNGNRINYDFSDTANIPIFEALAEIFENSNYTDMLVKTCGPEIGINSYPAATANAAGKQDNYPENVEPGAYQADVVSSETITHLADE